jgi:hypothetical protein
MQPDYFYGNPPTCGNCDDRSKPSTSPDCIYCFTYGNSKDPFPKWKKITAPQILVKRNSLVADTEDALED